MKKLLLNAISRRENSLSLLQAKSQTNHPNNHNKLNNHLVTPPMLPNKSNNNQSKIPSKLIDQLILITAEIT